MLLTTCRGGNAGQTAGAWAAPAVCPPTELRTHKYLHSNAQVLTCVSLQPAQLSDSLLAQTTQFHGSLTSLSYLTEPWQELRPGEGLGGGDRTCPLLMADISDLWPEDSPARAPADRQQAVNVWLSHKKEEVGRRGTGSEHRAAAGAESPEGTWVLSL